MAVAYLRLSGVKVGQGCFFGRIPEILLRDGARCSNIRIGDGVRFDGEVFLRLRGEGRIAVGNGVTIGKHVWLVTANRSEVRIGERTSIGAYGIFNGGNGIELGPDCLLGSHAYFCSSNHNMKKGRLVREQGYSGERIRLGTDVWVGGRVSVTQGVTIADGSVLGAGAVVTRDTEPDGIYAGVPARRVGERE
jgi:acetyltransferase-like isoleucine patch superfamily enzyme